MKRARCLIARLAVVSSSADHELKLSEPAAPGPADPGVDVTSLEAELDLTGERKGLGAYYTPPDVVDGLLRLTLGPILTELELAGSESVARVRVLDPTCGSGQLPGRGTQEDHSFVAIMRGQKNRRWSAGPEVCSRDRP